VISPYARHNYVDHALVDTTSILRFIEDNWQLGRIDSLDHPNGTPPGQGSFDQLAGSIEGLFDFAQSLDERPRFPRRQYRRAAVRPRPVAKCRFPGGSCETLNETGPLPGVALISARSAWSRCFADASAVH
jgi:phospholipase C